MKDYKQYHKFFDLVSEWIGNERSLNAKLDLMEETRHVAKRLRKRNYGFVFAIRGMERETRACVAA